MALLPAALASVSRTRHRFVCYSYVEKEWWSKASNGTLRSPTSGGSLQILQPIDAGFVSLLSILRKTATDDYCQDRPSVIREQRRSGSITGFALSLVSGILVLLNGAALLAPSFYRDWSSIFWWIPILGPNYVFMLGLIIGLTLILSSIIMVLRSGALAAMLIFPFAVFSLIIGGGFVAGMVLGIVGGIIGVLKR